MPPVPVRATCVIAVESDGRFLGEAVDSVLRQTRPPSEILVVADASTGEPPKPTGSPDQRIRVVRHPGDGAASARNRGASLATGHVITFLDPDELWHPRKLERQLSLFEKHPELGLCWARTQEIRSDGPAADGESPEFPSVEPPADDSVVDLVELATGTLAVRRPLFRRLGGFDEDRETGATEEFHRRASRFGEEVALMDEVLLYRRPSPQPEIQTPAGRPLDEILARIRSTLPLRRSASFPQQDVARG